MRSFYEHKEEVFTPDLLKKILTELPAEGRHLDARLKSLVFLPDSSTQPAQRSDWIPILSTCRLKALWIEAGTFRNSSSSTLSILRPVRVRQNFPSTPETSAASMRSRTISALRHASKSRSSQAKTQHRRATCPLPGGVKNRNAGHGEAGRRTGIRRTERCAHQVRRGCRPATFRGTQRRFTDSRFPGGLRSLGVAAFSRRRLSHLQRSSGRICRRLQRFSIPGLLDDAWARIERHQLSRNDPSLESGRRKTVFFLMAKPVILITGASQGIGEAIARVFSKQLRGCRLALVARSAKNLARVAKACERAGAKVAAIFPCDVTSRIRSTKWPPRSSAVLAESTC